MDITTTPDSENTGTNRGTYIEDLQNENCGLYPPHPPPTPWHRICNPRQPLLNSSLSLDGMFF